ncbi:MAG: 1-deoxy-D-xylulose-5-phosphate synthase [Actinobacteria bacterium]|nr:1-deoxy-D-xylulose-5-phosphate synthase [Actinomycetota bacterium]
MDDPVLDRINSPADLKKLDHRELVILAGEIRELIIATTSVAGGHIASSLGAVELAIAIQRVLDAPEDRVIWDVGHQAYAHKIIAGRRHDFRTLRQHGGISGFPRRAESEFDVVDSGHSGASISYGLGLALARDMKGEDNTIVVVIGDGSMTSGVAYEALNQAGQQLGSNLVIILNDNQMSISKNVGGFSSYLSRIRIKPAYKHLKEELEEMLESLPAVGDELVRFASHVKDSVSHALVPGILFEALGVKYVGPIDGHDIKLVEETIKEAKDVNGPVLIHVITRKGKGYIHAEQSPDKFHGVPPFDRETGNLVNEGGPKSYTSLFGDEMVKLARDTPELVAITAAMKLGTGLERFSSLYPDRFFDVGIAEQLAVNLAAGMAIGGMKPVVAIYSTFLQRAFDQLSQEVCLQELPVVFVVDRAGLVGEDGATHHGYFDVSYLRILPGMTVMAPGDGSELGAMLRFALELGSPVAVRFPRSSAVFLDGVGCEPIRKGVGEVIRSGEEITLLALGDMVAVAVQVDEILRGEGVQCTVVNARFAKPIDSGYLTDVCRGKRLVATLEDNIITGGFGSAVYESLREASLDVPVLVFGLPDRYVNHGTIEELFREIGLSPLDIAEEVRRHLDSL